MKEWRSFEVPAVAVKNHKALEKSIKTLFNSKYYGISWNYRLKGKAVIEYNISDTASTADANELEKQVKACVARREKRDNPVPKPKKEKVTDGQRIQIPASQIEFNVGGNTIWVHGPQGATILRIQTTGRITVNAECENICSHADIQVAGGIEVCVTEGDLK